MHNHLKAIDLYEQLNLYLKRYNIQTMQRLYLLSCYNLLKCYNKIGLYDSALNYGKLHLEHSEQHLSMELLPETYYELGMALIGLNREEEALIAFKKSMGIAQLFRSHETIEKVMNQLEKKYRLIFDKDLAKGIFS
jgi:tetratricopeptide (TPR) repeat protein